MFVELISWKGFEKLNVTEICNWIVDNDLQFLTISIWWYTIWYKLITMHFQDYSVSSISRLYYLSIYWSHITISKSYSKCVYRFITLPLLLKSKSIQQSIITKHFLFCSWIRHKFIKFLIIVAGVRIILSWSSLSRK